MKKMLILSAVASLLGGAALAQGVFGPYSLREDRGVPMISVYFDDGAGQTSKALSDTILKELERSIYFDFVPSPGGVTRIAAPTKLTVPASNKGAMKVGFQIAFPRGSEMDYTVSCDVGKPENCARAIRLRAERLYREYIENK